MDLPNGRSLETYRLGAEAGAVEKFLAGRVAQVVAEFQEIESGTRSDRTRLAGAMLMCRMTKATLLIAKLDRLARDAHFLLGLGKGGIDFVAADMPEANRLTTTVMAAMAEHGAPS